MTSLFSDVILVRGKWGMLKERGLATLQMVVWEGAVFKFYGNRSFWCRKEFDEKTLGGKKFEKKSR